MKAFASAMMSLSDCKYDLKREKPSLCAQRKHQAAQSSVLGWSLFWDVAKVEVIEPFIKIGDSTT